MTKPSLPKKGMSPEAVLQKLQAHRGEDVDWKGGRTFSLVYYAGEQVMQLLHDAYSMFMAENGLSPMAFPSLKTMENEVVAMTANMLHGGDTAAGSMTSGGTESIFMAMKTAREWSRKHMNCRRTFPSADSLAPHYARNWCRQVTLGLTRACGGTVMSAAGHSA